MTRLGLTISIVIAVVVGLVFGLWPELDLAISRPFARIIVDSLPFGLRIDPAALMVQHIGAWLVTAMMAAALGALLIKLVVPRAKLLISSRAAVFLLVAVLLGPGLIVNGILKEHWGRERPVDVVEMGGSGKFTPWWSTSGTCPRNCSFVSGDVSMAFWTIAPAVLVPPPWQALAVGSALAFGIAAASMRMLFGAHFFTDAAFAGLLTFWVIWLLHGLMYRWPQTRLTDDDVESAIERTARWWARLFSSRESAKRPRTP